MELRLLGPLEVRAHGEPLPPPRLRKAHWALALLALRAGREVDREWLAGTLWPESAAPQAFYNLRRCLSELRAALGDQAARLRAPTRRTLCLDLAGASVDVVAFEQAVARGDPASLEAAVALYRGPLLEGCAEEWVFQEREARQEEFLQALQQLARHALARGEPGLAAAHLRRAAAVDPLQESVQRALIEALAADGNFAAAAETYRDLRLRLHRELNAAPDPETTALFDRIRGETGRRRSVGSMEDVGVAALRADRIETSRTAPPIRLPQPLTRLVGREAAVDEIRGCLATARLVTLTGLGGMGKTRLAIAVGGLLAPDYPDGVWFVNLAPVVEPSQVAAAVGQALDLRVEGPPGGEGPLAEALLAALAPRRLLLILDNCEHLAEACARLAAALLGGCRSLRLLATSRQPLGLTGELAWRVPCLDQDPSVQLFIERARFAHSGFTVTARSLPVVARICRRLEGIPLAIELAAAHARATPLDEIAARLDDQLRFLTDGSPTLPRHQTLRAALDWSYQLLTGSERAMLRQLSVFVGGWTLDAAEAIADCGLRVAVRGATGPEGPDNPQIRHPQRGYPRHPQSEVLALLTALVDRSLVLFDEPARTDGGPARYRMLETVREYAGEQLAKSGEARAARFRHRDYFLQVAGELAVQLADVERLDGLEALTTEQDNLRAALAWSLAEEPEVGLRLAIDLDWFWRWRSRLGEGCEWVQRLLAACPALGGELRAEAYLRLARWTEWQGAFAAAGEWYRQGLAAARTSGDAMQAALALLGLGVIGRQQGDYRRAAAFVEESAAVYQGAGADRECLRARTELGSLYHQLGDDQRASAILVNCLEMARRLGDRRITYLALDQLGDLARDRSEYAAARAFYLEKLALVRAAGLHEFVVYAINDLGLLARQTGDLVTAGARMEEALGVARQVGSPMLQTICLIHLAGLAYAKGDLEPLRAAAQESLEIAWRAQEMGRVVPALHRLAALAVARGEAARAARLLAAADRLEESHGPVTLFHEREFRAELVVLARASLDEPTYLAAQAEGGALPTEQVVQDALRWAGSPVPP